MSSLANRQKQILLQVARRALTLAVECREAPRDFPQDEQLIQPAGAFITLHRHRRLRGCIGQLASIVPLVHVVAYCAKAAALEDPRFEPVHAQEVGEIEIEISVLSDLEVLLPSQIKSGTHGLVVSKGWQRGILLPQVAREYGWTPIRFLEETCSKAGLDRNAWQDSATRIQAFTAEVFSESSHGLGEKEERTGSTNRLNAGYSSST